jgi:hypothetical protein
MSQSPGQCSSSAALDCRFCSAVAEPSALLKDGVFPSCQRFPPEMGGFSPGLAHKTLQGAAVSGCWMGKTAVPLTAPVQPFAPGQRRCGSGAKGRQSCSLTWRPVFPGVGLPL